MPTYDYECQACKHAFQVFQTMSAKVLRKCPECKKPRLLRLIGPGAGFLFKGSGFYSTDYRSESYKSGQKSEAPASTDAGPAKADAKPASKPTAAAKSPSPQAPSPPKDAGKRERG